MSLFVERDVRSTVFCVCFVERDVSMSDTIIKVVMVMLLGPCVFEREVEGRCDLGAVIDHTFRSHLLHYIW